MRSTLKKKGGVQRAQREGISFYIERKWCKQNVKTSRVYQFYAVRCTKRRA